MFCSSFERDGETEVPFLARRGRDDGLQGYVRRPGHLPVAEALGVLLADPVAGGRLALRVEHHHRCPQVVTHEMQPFGNPGLLGALAASGTVSTASPTSSGVPPPKYMTRKSASKRRVMGWTAFQIRGQPGRRLRGAVRDEAAYVEAPHRIEVAAWAPGCHRGRPPA